MAEKDLPSNSDESDEDFIPEGNATSEEDSVSGHSEDESNDEKEPKSKRRRKLVKRKKKGEDTSKSSKENDEKPEKTNDVDALWADFKQDVSKMEKKATSYEKSVTDKKSSDSKNETPIEDSGNTSKTVQETKKRSFPSTLNNSSKLGLNKILNQLGKKEKMSTLAKSKLDWNNFKKSEGIEDEIKTHNRGKDGYLEKQDFLQRTDLRQFEIEKQMRASRRHF